MTETQQTSGGRDFWEDVRDTVLEGMRDLRDKGDDFARRSRIRMDILRAQRRLRQAQETLGEYVYSCLKSGSPVTADDPVVREHMSNVDTFLTELIRLREELERIPK